MPISALFYPKSVAVVGASREAGSVGNELVKNLVKQGYRGRIYPINPKGGQLFDLTVKPDLLSVRGQVDLVIIAVPAKIVPQILEQAGHKKVKAAIVIGAGFKEAGQLALENQLIQLSTKYKIPLIGPNCLGLINPEIHLNASFAPIMPEFGSLAFISQSGAICSSVLDYARQRGLGFSKFVSIGNKAVLGEVELLEYLYRDPKTKVVLLYVEQLSQIARLMKITKRMTQGKPHKPIIILKSGRTSAGARASQSHTGALAGSDEAYDAFFAQSGMIRAESIAELFDFAECFVHNKLPKDNRVAIVTNAGGPGVLTTDELIEEDLHLAELSEETTAALASFLPAAASYKNPIDILGDAPAERYQKTIAAVLKDPQVDAVQIILTPQSMTQIEATAKAIARLKQQTTKPMVVTFMGQRAVEKGVKILHDQDVATTLFPEPGASALSALYQFKQWLQPRNDRGFRFSDVKRERVEKLIAEAEAEGTTLVNTDLVFKMLKAYGLPVVKRRIVTSAAEAEAVARKFDQPVVLKIISPDISHKTEAGGVILNVELKQVKAKYQELLNNIKFHDPNARVTGVEVMAMVAEPGLEMIMGVTTDPGLGKVMMIGLGGIYTEALKDVAWGLVPLTHADVDRMIGSLKAHQILKGTRGQPPYDIESLAECLARLSLLARHFPQIKEIDINPIRVMKAGNQPVILDARMIIF